MPSPAFYSQALPESGCRAVQDNNQKYAHSINRAVFFHVQYFGRQDNGTLLLS